MASESILLVIRRMWEYFAVPSQGNIGFAPEEHDPVGEFLERQSRGGGLTEAETETGMDKEILPMSNFETESNQPNNDISPSSFEVLETEFTAGRSESESEVLPPAAGIGQNDAGNEVIQEMTDSEQSRDQKEVPPQSADIPPDTAKDEAAEGVTEKGHKDATDDLLDIFRNEKEMKEKNTLHDSLADVDIRELLQESKDLMAELNARRYKRT
jgi:hypothetical protein